MVKARKKAMAPAIPFEFTEAVARLLKVKPTPKSKPRKRVAKLQTKNGR